MTIYDLIETLRDDDYIEIWDAKVYYDIQREGWQVAPGYSPWKGTVEEFKVGDQNDPEEGCLYEMMCEDDVKVVDHFFKPDGTICILYKWW